MKRYDNRPLKSEQLFKHSKTCRAADVEPEHVALANGKVLHRCLTCGGFGVPADEYQEPALKPRPTGPRCGSHPHRPVDGRGRGCPDCRDESSARRSDKRRGYRGPR